MSANDAVVAQLLTASSQAARIKGIANDADFVFDFLKGTRASGQGGFLVSANAANFPALLTGNGAMTIGVLAPCGLNSPHIHPRATELQLVTSGGPIQAAFIQENAVRTVQNTIPVGSATIFPKGSLHFQQNLGCEPTTFVASFDFVDPGALQAAQNFFALDKSVLNATLGGVGVGFLDSLQLPANVVLGAQECLDRCGIDRSSFNFTTTFKDYMAFSNSTWAAPPALSPSVSSAYGSPSATTSGVSLSSTSTGAPKNLGLLADGSVDVPFSQNPLRPAVIGLGAACAALLLALLGMMVMTCCRRRRGGSRGIPVPSGSGRGYPYVTPYDDTETLASTRSTFKS